MALHLTRDDVRAALNDLPIEQKQAIELAYFEGLTCDEIAQRTDSPVGTVKGRIRLGMQKLYRVLVVGIATPNAGRRGPEVRRAGLEA